jgi:hypothetical protein
VSPSDPSDSGERRRAPAPDPARARDAEPGRADEEPGRADDEEDALDLAELEALGVDGVIAKMHDDPLPGDPVAPARVRGGRSSVLSVVITVLGLYLLFDAFPDFRYWLRSSTPEDLGEAATLVEAGQNPGQMPKGLHDRYVTVRGTPDVQNAVRMTTEERIVGYLRITEAGGSLFAAAPREKDEPMLDKFDGKFTGRLRKMDRDPAYEWLTQYIAAHPITRTLDATPKALLAAVASTGGSMGIKTNEGPITLVPGDVLHVVVQSPDSRVQIGTGSVRKPEDAEARVAALGHPYAVLPGRSESPFHTFVVRIPESERTAALAKLQEGLDDPSKGTDPKRGAAVLPGSSTLSVKPDEIAISGDDLVVTAPEAGTPLYDVVGGKLVARAPEDGRLRVPTAWVQSVRIERPIPIDPNGYVVAVGDDPSKHWMIGLVWLVVATLVGLNVASLIMRFRRSTAMT